MLFLGYPYKAASNPVFYVKLALIGLGLALAVKIRAAVLAAPAPDMNRARRLASASLGAWGGAILAGRLLAYTFTWLRVGVPGGF